MPTLRASLLVLTIVAVCPCAQIHGALSCATITYEDHNYSDYALLPVGRTARGVQDIAGALVPGACIGVFTEPDHKLVASVISDDKGRFHLPPVPDGQYRLLVQYQGLCTANATIGVRSHAAGQLRAVMMPRGIDSCSYIQRRRPFL